ncbi:HNH endonuclease signature motif containing protein [Delftia acidovorans]|uniref:HNH endonuclease signature motif containing protein n=1 Tax=Delftia acidovorans TaxID=80866 RepID=UPI00286F41E5|nr:HNH endonuclease signature motif containing protein [Delftia acidovorans]
MTVNFHDYLSYEPETGRLTWKVTRDGRGCIAGSEVGSVKHDGRYRSFVLRYRRYYVHRVAWELVNGPIPEGLCIDHIDGNGLNNRISNLRVVSLSLNQRNRKTPKSNKTGIPGITPHRGGFSVHCGGKYIKFTKDFFEACCIRRSAELRMGYL